MTVTTRKTADSGYECWLGYRKIQDRDRLWEFRRWGSSIVATPKTLVFQTAVNELQRGLRGMLKVNPVLTPTPPPSGYVRLAVWEQPDEEWLTAVWNELGPEGYLIRTESTEGRITVIIGGKTEKGVLYGVFCLLRMLQINRSLPGTTYIENPQNPLRLINHWDNPDGSIERGYAGNSIFFRKNRLIAPNRRIRDYARLLASIGVNGIVVNNVNVRKNAIQFNNAQYLARLAAVAEVFRAYGIRLYLSINFASLMLLGNLTTADPLDDEVRRWWREQAAVLYGFIPDFGGFLVKADSEFTPGPFTYGRNHTDGANMLAEALEPFGGLVMWRCFVYNCVQDWRDQSIDRARAAYDHFKPLDGAFHDNVLLQIKNGPVDFQVREPVSPLFGGLSQTNQLLELQITQEYTGQQKDLCFLAPQWQEVLEFDTFAQGAGTQVRKIVAGAVFRRKFGGIAGISNIGSDLNWTGHDLAQANLYGYGRLAWNPDLSVAAIAAEWAKLTFGGDPEVAATITDILLQSWPIYEKYNAPLGIGWMVNPGHHYGPNVDGYEYSRWGTYHRADNQALGVDRTGTGTGFTGQYHKPNTRMYDSVDTCPEELLLFFHRLPYTHRLPSGKTLIQHIYDSRFEGVEKVRELRDKWLTLEGRILAGPFQRVLKRLDAQLENAIEWRDVVNSYFHRKSGIPDQLGRKIY